MPNFKHVIFCDDIRTESNGKKLLIGVYTGGLAVESFPFGSKVAILIVIDSLAEGASIALEVRLKSGAKIVEFVGDLPPPPQDAGLPGYLELAVPLMLSAEDTLEVHAGSSTTELELIGHLPITRGLEASP